MAVASFLIALLVCVPLPSAANSQTSSLSHSQNNNVNAEYQGYLAVIHSLTKEGYTVLVVERTMLKRIRILSRKGPSVRETIVSSSTGIVLRDNTWLE